MRKNGFTLVELLAVIAILAILVIIALPNVMSMFNQARKNSFSTEVKEIYKMAQQQWISDSLFTTSEKVYSRCESCSGKSLDMSGRSQLEYYIKIDKSGKVVEYYATDGSYQYSYNNSNGLNIEDIDDIKVVAELPSNQVLHIESSGAELGEVTYLYFNNDVDWDSFVIGADVPTLPYNRLHDNYQDAMNDKNLPYFIRLKVSGGKVSAIDLGYLLNNNIYYVNREMSESELQSVLFSSFGESNCNMSEGRCELNDLTLYFQYSLEIYYSDEYWFCGIQDRWGGLCSQP